METSSQQPTPRSPETAGKRPAEAHTPPSDVLDEAGDRAVRNDEVTAGARAPGDLSARLRQAAQGVRAGWQWLLHWLRANTFTPSWLPPHMRHAPAGYLIAVLLEGSAVLLTLLLGHAFAGLAFPDLLCVLIVVVVALNFGAGPSLAATLASATLLDYFLLPPVLSLGPKSKSDWGSLVLLMLVGIAISVAASQVARERRAAQRANEQLVEANANMDSLLHLVSHELRNPLASLILGAGAAQRQVDRLTAQVGQSTQVEKLADALQRMRRQSERMNRMVGDLLDVARVQTGKLEMTPAPCDLAALVREVTDEQRRISPPRAILLQAPDGPVPVNVDAQRVTQVLTNYLTNALKYSESDQPVHVRLERLGTKARVSVRDRGPGLTREQQARIWERGYRTPEAQVLSGTGVGLGLGLYIARSIIEGHGGQVGVQSVPGSGATFFFTLPIASTSLPISPAAPSAPSA
jgi:signal transduction histidine kinase